MGRIKAFLLVVYLSLKWVFRVNLGDYVYFRGNTHLVCNGVRYNQWRLNNLENGDEGWVNRSECKKVLTVKNLLGSFKSGYGFYMSCWYKIWVRSGIEPWMLNCKIW